MVGSKMSMFSDEEYALGPIEDKHVAVWLGGSVGGSPVVRAVENVFRLSDEPLRYQIYSDANSIINALPHLCGIVSLSVAKRVSVESYLRHELKNRPSWSYEEAQVVVLPPCEDCDMLQVMHAVPTIIQMQTGRWNEDQRRSFSLEKDLALLLPHMGVPTRPLSVVLVDDMVDEASGMLKLLQAWPDINTTFISESHQLSSPRELSAADIILLDEDLSQWKAPPRAGTRVWERLSDSGLFSRTIFASTTAGSKPSFTRWHFPAKRKVAGDFDQALNFVYFMNQLVDEVKA